MLLDGIAHSKYIDEREAVASRDLVDARGVQESVNW